MLAFFNRLLNTVSGNNFFTKASNSSEDDGDLGLSRPDVNFYFAAISVCSPFMNLLELTSDTNHERICKPSRNSVTEKISTLPQASIFGFDMDQAQISDATKQAITLHSTKKTIPATCTIRDQFDCMNLFDDRIESQERYYVPKPNRMSRISKCPTTFSKSILSVNTDQRSENRTNTTASPEQLKILATLHAMLEEYRMIVTNSTEALIATPLLPKDQEAVVVSVSIQSLMKNSQTASSTALPNFDLSNLPSAAPRSLEECSSKRTGDVYMSAKCSSPSSASRPTALSVTIPTTASLRSSGLHVPSEDPSGMMRRLLSSSPALEFELRERAADVWGTAIGLEDASSANERIGEELQRSQSEQYKKKRDILKQQIRNFLLQFGILEKFEKELAIVKKGNSKFHQAQQVVPGLWVGSFYAASNRVRLYSLGITHVVCCVNVQPPFTRDFHYLVLPCEDKSDQDILKYFARTNHFIKTALMEGGRVLVHCGAGISRAPAVCAAFLIHELQVSADLALRLVQHSYLLTCFQEARPFADPNEGFREQLRIFQSIVQSQLAPTVNGGDLHKIQKQSFMNNQSCLVGSQQPYVIEKRSLNQDINAHLSNSGHSTISCKYSRESDEEEKIVQITSSGALSSSPPDAILIHSSVERNSTILGNNQSIDNAAQITGVIVSSKLPSSEIRESTRKETTTFKMDRPFVLVGQTDSNIAVMNHEENFRQLGCISSNSKYQTIDGQLLHHKVYVKHVGYFTSQHESKRPLKARSTRTSSSAILNVHSLCAVPSNEERTTSRYSDTFLQEGNSNYKNTIDRKENTEENLQRSFSVDLEARYPLSPTNGSSSFSRSRVRSHSYATSFTVTPSDIALVVLEQRQMNSLLEKQRVARERERQLVTTNAILHAERYSAHLAGIENSSTLGITLVEDIE